MGYLAAQPEKSVFGHIAQLYELGLGNLMKLLGDISEGRTPALQVQDPAAFKYFRLPDAGAFSELRARGVEPVSYDIYAKLIQSFIPAAIYSQAQSKLDASTIEQATTAIHADGTDKVLTAQRASLESLF